MFFRNWSGKQVLAGVTAAVLLLGAGQTVSLLRADAENQSGHTAEATQESGTAEIISGIVIRQERVIYGDDAVEWQCTVPEGSRVAAGETLFRAQPSMETQTWAERKTLIEQAAQDREKPLYQRRQLLWAAIRTGSRSQIRSLMLAEPEDAPATAYESAPEGRGGASCQASESGVFSANVDGLEEILTPEHWREARVSLPLAPRKKAALGRLITSDTWYFAGTSGTYLEPGQECRAALLGGGFGTCTLRVEQVESTETGWQILFSCTQRLEAASSVRQLSVKILSD